MAARNNPLISVLGISFDTFNLLHRWLGRIVIIEAFAHTVAFLAAQEHKGSLSAGFQVVFNAEYMFWGFLVCHVR